MTTVIYGQKIEMGEAFVGGNRHGVTKIALFPMTVSQIKSVEKDGYEALQVAFGKPKKRTNKSLTGHLKSSGVKASTTQEIPFEAELSVGTTISPMSVVKVGSLCTIQGTSKGKGFAGVVKRYGFAGGPRTHGQSDRLRAPGSIGQGTTPGRVHKGKKMAGHMGVDTVTTKNALVVSFNEADNSIWVTGPVPGHRHSLVRLVIAGFKEIPAATYLTGQISVPAPVIVEAVQMESETPVEEVVTASPVETTEEIVVPETNETNTTEVPAEEVKA
jgi:large subunit ribosomal protein L3